MDKVICFGEIMGRLNPKGYLRFTQADEFEISYAGAEANVAVSLARFGANTAFITKLPPNDLGECAVRELRKNGVDTRQIIYGGERLGMYYVEKGASQRASKVIYDRKYSSVSMAQPSDFDWDDILGEATWFHITGITPPLGEHLPAICLEALKTARMKGITTSCDLNYRKNLWSREEAGKIMSELMPYVNVCISNEEDASDVFGIKADDTNLTGGVLSEEGYRQVAARLMERFGFGKVAITLRRSISADDNEWSALLYDGKDFCFSDKYRIHVVDRVGGGDSFSGALIYACIRNWPLEETVRFAAAASCLKHSIEHDFNLVSIDEVQKLMQGDGSGRVSR